MSGIKKAASVAAFMAAGLLSQPAAAVPVGLELALLVDVSGSVDATEFNLQKGGYVSAFQSAAVQNAILASQGGAIAATLIYWSGATQQAQVVPWTLINSAASANAFAAAINATTQLFQGSTAPGSAIAFADGLFGTETGGLANGFESLRQVMDVSGDGAANDGINTLGARNAALAAGVDTINGLVILGESGLLAFYQNNIAGGTNAFVDVADSFADFATAIERKLIKEISQVPEPGTLGLLALALLGFGGAMRRRI